MLKLYTTHCPKCRVIEAKLKAKHIEFEVIDDVAVLEQEQIKSVPVLEVDTKRMSFLEANQYVNNL